METPPEWMRRLYRNTKAVQYRGKGIRMMDLGDPAVIEALFTYHAPRPEQLPKYQAIRDAAKIFAKVLVENTPKGPDQSAAVRHLRECVMTANAAIALEGKV